jgi:methyl-accepting chemotaxis protein
MAALTSEIAGNMNEMATGVREINSAVGRVNELSAGNKDRIDDLVAGVSKFKV